MKTAADFIAFFEAIPEDRWCTGRYHSGDAHCAYGHLMIADGVEGSDNAFNFGKLMGSHRYSVSSINDGAYSCFHQPTPRQRILAALQQIAATTA